jgi:hypothetical protein
MEEQVTQKTNSSRRVRHSIFFPMLLVTIGVILLLHTLHILPGSAWGTILRYWPVLLIVSALDSIYRGDGYVGAVIWGGIGLFLLLSNLGMLPYASWTVLLRWWPVLLIAVGLDLIIGRHSIWSAVIGIVLGVVILGGVVWLSVGMTPTAPVETRNLEWDLQSAETINASLNATAGDLNIGGGAQKGNAVQAVISLSGNEEIEDSYTVKAGEGYFDLENKGLLVLYPAFQSPTAKTSWEIQFNEDTPLELNSELIAGEQELDLNGLKVEYFNTKTIFGKTTIRLPEEGSFNGDAEVIFGELVVYVPEDAAVRIYADTGLTGVDLPDDYTREDDLILSPSAKGSDAVMELDLNQPIGSLRVIYY